MSEPEEVIAPNVNPTALKKFGFKIACEPAFQFGIPALCDFAILALKGSR
jgi:hypothetical protein